MVTKATFVGAGFTRKPPKYERFIRPTGLRFTKAHVTHPELKCTFNLDIISVKKNPNGPMYTSLGVMTRGTIIEVCQAILPIVVFITLGIDYQSLRLSFFVSPFQKMLLTMAFLFRWMSVNLVLLLLLEKLFGVRDPYLCTYFCLIFAESCYNQISCVTGKYAQVTNNPENDGCINAVLLV